MKQGKQGKTNAMRRLETAGIVYTQHEHDTADGLLDGVSVAAKTGQEPARVFKTLVTLAPGGGAYVFCIPVAAELGLKGAARAAGVKSIAMLPPKDLLATTGYVKGGCSPIGMKKALPTFIEESAFLHDTILVSGGRIGLQIEIAPADLQAVCGAKRFML